MDILLFCPTYRLEPETVDSIFRLDWDPSYGRFDIVFSRWNLPTDCPDDGRVATLANFCQGSALALSGGYDALLTFESDIIAPPRALVQLHDGMTEDGWDVLNGLYMFRRGKPVCNALRWIEGAKFPDSSFSLFPGLLEENWGKTVRVSGGGLGLSLIHRHVLLGCPFRDDESQHTDWAFIGDCIKAGYRMGCDLDIICGHKRPEDNRILWPDLRPEGYCLTQGREDSAWHIINRRLVPR